MITLPEWLYLTKKLNCYNFNHLYSIEISFPVLIELSVDFVNMLIDAKRSKGPG